MATSRASLLAIVSLFSLAGCTAEMVRKGSDGPPPALDILTPEADTWVGSTSVVVTGTARDVDQVVVNGVVAMLIGESFTATIHVEEGRQRIEAIAGPNTDSVEINVDATPPRIVMFEPATGFVEGRELRVEGRVIDANPVTVTVDGEDVPVGEDGSFALHRDVEPGAYRIRVKAEDPAAQTTFASAAAIVGDFVPASEMVDSAAGLALGQNGLRDIGNGAGDMLTRRSFDSEVTAVNPVYDAWWAEANVRGEDHGTVGVTLDPTTGALDVTVRIDDLNVYFDVDPPVFSAVDGLMHADRVIIHAPVSMTASGGDISIAMDDATVMMEGFRCELDAVPSWVENMEAVRGAVRRRVESAVQDAVRSSLPPFLEEKFAGVLPNRPIEIMGVSLDVRSRLGELAVSDGGVYAAVDLVASPASAIPSRVANGVLRLGDRAAPTESSADVVIDVALDTLNMATFAAWSAGLFQRRIDSVPFRDGMLTVSQLGLIAPGIGGDVADPDAPVAIVIDMALPPVVTSEDVSVRLRAVDVRVELIAVVDGHDQSLGTLSIDVQAPVTPSIAGGALTIDIGELAIAADPVGDGPEGLPRGERLDELLTDLAGTFAGPLLDFGGITIPSIAGFTLAPAGFIASGNWITFEGDLAYAP